MRREQVLIRRLVSSFAIDSLCDQAREQYATLACFYFDFAVKKEQSAMRTLGSPLKRLACELGGTPEVSRAPRPEKNSTGGRGRRLSGIVLVL